MGTLVRDDDSLSRFIWFVQRVCSRRLTRVRQMRRRVALKLAEAAVDASPEGRDAAEWGRNEGDARDDAELERPLVTEWAEEGDGEPAGFGLEGSYAAGYPLRIRPKTKRVSQRRRERRSWVWV